MRKIKREINAIKPVKGRLRGTHVPKTGVRKRTYGLLEGYKMAHTYLQ